MTGRVVEQRKAPGTALISKNAAGDTAAAGDRQGRAVTGRPLDAQVATPPRQASTRPLVGGPGIQPGSYPGRDRVARWALPTRPNVALAPSPRARLWRRGPSSRRSAWGARVLHPGGAGMVGHRRRTHTASGRVARSSRPRRGALPMDQASALLTCNSTKVAPRRATGRDPVRIDAGRAIASSRKTPSPSRSSRARAGSVAPVPSRDTRQADPNLAPSISAKTAMATARRGTYALARSSSNAANAETTSRWPSKRRRRVRSRGGCR